jgi:hypothetical protein
MCALLRITYGYLVQKVDIHEGVHLNRIVNTEMWKMGFHTYSTKPEIPTTSTCRAPDTTMVKDLATFLEACQQFRQTSRHNLYLPDMVENATDA